MKEQKRRIRYPTYRKCKTNVLARTSNVLDDLRRLFPELSLTESSLVPILARCRRRYDNKLHYGRDIPENRRRIRKLTVTEQMIYNHLVNTNFNENGKIVKLNPSTLYRQFLAVRVPDDIKQQLQEGKISQQLAIDLARNRKARRHFGEGQVILNEFVNAMSGMRW